MTQRNPAPKITTENPSPEKDLANMPLIPPVIVLLMLVAGITLHWLFPMTFYMDLGGIGLILTAAGLGAIIWCRKLFEKAGTNVSAHLPSLAIVTTGPYKYSRNPIYVCFLVIYTGLTFMNDAPAMLFVLPVLYYVLDKYVVAPEEAYLEKKFGQAYTDYRNATPRWVGFKL